MTRDLPAARRLATAAVVQLVLVAVAMPGRAQEASCLPQEPVTPLPQWHAVKPNVVYVLCDDLGYGDVHCLNPDRGKIPTPNVDRLASQGMTFTDAHASSTTCTPTRYAILTGRYDWRSRFTQVPTLHKPWPKNGGVAPGFEPIGVLPTLVTRACDVVRGHAAATPGADHRPFFLYLALTSPHTPLVPTKEWQGKSGLGPYGDFVMETDWALGQVLRSLDDAGLAGQTIVCFTSDNGCAPYVGVKQLEGKGHYPSGQFRGYKSDIWDGGHREPFLVRWPGTVAAGARSDQTVCLGDLMATLAQLTAVPLPADAGEDSLSLLPILLGAQRGPLRYAQVHHSKDGNFALRRGKWRLELCPGSCGWGSPTDKQARAMDLPAVQLYDMEADPGEQRKVQADHSDLVAAMTKLLEASVADGRTTPGPVEPNDAPGDIWNLPKASAATTPPADGHE